MTVISRSKIDHPILGTVGGAALHASINTLYSKLGDNANSRYFTVDALADSASQDFDHNFKDSFDELTVLLYLHNTGSGELTRINASSSPAIGDFDIVAKVGDETKQITVTNNSGGPQDLACIVIQAGGASAGGGGGGSLNWDEPPGSSPVAAIENGQKVFLFEAGSSNNLVAFIKIPASHSPGAQLNMNVSMYTSSSSQNIKMETSSYLIRKNTDAIDSVANSHASTNANITNTAPSNKLQEATVDLTDGSGQINSLTVQPGDMIKVELSRGTDTDPADIKFIPNGTEVN